MQKVIGVEDKLPLSRMLPLSVQHLLAMFAATVLVPFLLNMDPAVAIFTSGLGTLLFIAITGGRVPSYLGSSFAFIVPFQVVSQTYGLGYALGAGSFVGITYLVLAQVIRAFGTDWVERLLPPVVIGSVIIVIGLSLAPTAIGMATRVDGDYNALAFSAALVALLGTAITAVFFRGFLGTIPVLVGIVVGYIYSLLTGQVDFSPVLEARWFQLPQFQLPNYGPNVWAAALTIVPLSLVTFVEHLGDQAVTSSVIGRKTWRDPGLHRTLSGDGLASTVATLLGGPINTTYGENIAVLAITKVYSVWVIGGAAVLALVVSVVGKVAAILRTIPVPVMGGISIVLFGMIAASGLRTLVDNRVDYSDRKNMLLTAVIVVLGIGGAKITLGQLTISGMALAAIVGVVLNYLFSLRPDPVEDQVEAVGDEI